MRSEGVIADVSLYVVNLTQAFLSHLEHEISARYSAEQGKQDAPLITRARHRHHVQVTTDKALRRLHD